MMGLSSEMAIMMDRMVFVMSCLGLSRYTLEGEARTAKHFSMIAGGTGITPCYQARPCPSPLLPFYCSLNICQIL